MTVSSKSDLLTLDFTGKISNLEQASPFDQTLVDEIREKSKNGVSTFLVIDTGYAGQFEKPIIVKDHINLTGTNPLVGPNDEIGERFPVVNDIYLSANQISERLGTNSNSDCFEDSLVAAGIKPGVVPTDKEIALFNSLGADFYCYNLIPAALIIAHAKKKLLGLILPPKIKAVESVEELLGGNL